MLQFPVWLLTAAALSEAIIRTLVRKYEFEVAWHDRCNARRERKRPSRYAIETKVRLRENLEKRAARASEGVILDFQALLGVKEVRSI